MDRFVSRPLRRRRLHPHRGWVTWLWSHPTCRSKESSTRSVSACVLRDDGSDTTTCVVFSPCSSALRSADPGSVLRSCASLCRPLHGSVWTRPFACGLDAQPLFGRVACRAGRSPADILSGRVAGPPTSHGRAGHRTVGSAEKSLARLRYGWNARSGAATGAPSDAGSTCSPEALAPPLRAWLHRAPG
jgi:hypothetical protein